MPKGFRRAEMLMVSPSPAPHDLPDTSGHRWRARPVLAALLQCALLSVPLLTSSACVYLTSRLLGPDAARGWLGLALLLVVAVLSAVGVERATRRLLPIALLLKLSMVFPDRAPSRLKLARAAAVRQPKDELLWSGPDAEPTSTSELVLGLVAALGSHDRRTRGHSERVRLLCDMLAAELALDQDARDRLRWSALLHDVGKMRVSTAILNKPGRLDTREFDRIKQHPAAGAELAAPLMPWLGEWGEGILDHHEKYDGTGYPSGKAGVEISRAGRLIGLVDAFETMTAARPYKKAMATKAAREELARCAGTHFDPVFVRAFLAISLPRVLWAMGPLSFLFQLPFLRPLAHAGSRTAASAPQAVNALATGAAGAAGAAVLVTGGVTAGVTAAPDVPDRRAVTASQELSAPAPERDETGADRTAATSPVPPGAPAAAAGPAERRSPSSSQPLVRTGSGTPAAQRTPPAQDRGAAPAPRPVDPQAVDPPADQTPVDQPPAEQPPAERPPGEQPPGEQPPAEQPPAEPDPDDGEPDEPAPQGPEPAEPDPSDSGPPPAVPGPDAPPASAPPAEPPPAAEPPQDEPDPPAKPMPRDEAPAGGDTTQSGVAILSGPPATTTSRSAVFELADPPTGSWECQIKGNGGGESSAWVPCDDVWTVTVQRDGEHSVRVRNAVTGQPAGSWTWTVVSTTVSAQGAVDPQAVAPVLSAGPAETGQPAEAAARDDAGVLGNAAAPVAPPTTAPVALLALALAAGAALPVAALARRLRSRRT